MARLPFLVVLGLVACRREVVDGASTLCFVTPIGAPGTLVAEVTQLGGDEAPEDGTCTITDDGAGFVLRTSFWFDADTSPLWEELPLTQSTASCAAEIHDDPVAVTYAGQELVLPTDGAEHCFVQSDGTLVADDAAAD